MFAPFFWDIFLQYLFDKCFAMYINFVMVIWEMFCYNLIWKNIYILYYFGMFLL